MKKFFLVMIFLGSLSAFGQYNIILLSSENIYLKSQLWNLSIANTRSVTSFGARMHLEMKDLATHQTIMSAVSNSFQIAPGVKILQMRSFEPITYNYTSGQNIDRSDNGMLPVGKYEICYQLVITEHEYSVIAATDCDQVEIAPMSPPLLQTPDNDSILKILTPAFTWTPPTPINMFGDLNYDILISEVYKGQSLTDALQNNLPVQLSHGLRQPFYNFSAQGVPLEKNKIYAWQIIARDGDRFGVKSEVWSFRTDDKKILQLPTSVTYLLVDEKTNGTGILDSNTLHLKYISSIAAHQVPLLFKDQNGNNLYKINKEVKQGDNYWDIPLPRSFGRNIPYTVTISDTKTTMLYFIIK